MQNPPPVGKAWFHSLRSVRPIRRNFGLDSGGQCVDRYYIERFLDARSADVKGRVLEIGDNAYTMRYGGAKVTRSDVLHARPGNSAATIVGDLSTGQGIPDGAFDCMILTQTLPFIYDVEGTIRTIHRLLAPGGVALLTMSGISQISRYDMEQWGDFWRFTAMSAERLFTEVFQPERVTVEAHGNVLAAVAFLHGIVVSELKPEELDFRDPDYEVTITLRAVKE